MKNFSSDKECAPTNVIVRVDVLFNYWCSYWSEHKRFMDLERTLRFD